MARKSIYTYTHSLGQLNDQVYEAKTVQSKEEWIVENLDGTRMQLPNPSLKEQITVAFQSDTGLEESFESVSLPVETVDDTGA